MWTSRESQSLAGRLVMVTPDLHNALGLARAIPGLRVLTGTSDDAGPPPDAVAALGAAGAEVRVVGIGGARNTTGALLAGEPAGRVLKEWGSPAVVVFRPAAQTASRLGELGCATLAARAGIARRLENKKFFRGACRDLSLPVVDTREMRWPPSDRNRAVWGRWDGEAVVVQTARGQAGNRTWLWQVGGELPPISDRLMGRPMLLAPLLPGPTWTVNAVVGASGVRVGAPMRQITGDPRLCPLPFASSGVALSAPGTAAVAEELAALARAVGGQAAEAGFRGFFGIDAVGEPGDLRLIEMNARLTATLTVATLAELEAGHRPLLVDHVLACLGEAAAPAGDIPAEALDGGHLIVRESSGYVADVPALGSYHVTALGIGERSPQAGLPASGSVTVWPAGTAWGTAADRRGRLLFSDAIVGEEGAFTPFVERTVDAIVRPA